MSDRVPLLGEGGGPLLFLLLHLEAGQREPPAGSLTCTQPRKDSKLGSSHTEISLNCG